MKKLAIALVAGSLLAANVAQAATPCLVCARPQPVRSLATPGIIYGIWGCAGGIIVAALIKNATHHRELTPAEAWSCGVGALFNPN